MSLLIGVILVLIGVSTVRSFGLLLLLFGVVAIIGSFKAVIAVGSAGGGGTTYSHLPWEAASAKKMINELNQLIADI